MSQEAPIASLAFELARRIRGLPRIEGGPERLGGLDVRRYLELTLELKVLPELSSRCDLPLFVGVQGGTNTGKSTIFNALCGQLLSPAIVLASATKHPLAYLHERWRERFLKEDLLSGFVPRELEDSRELIVEPEATQWLYLRFHADDELRYTAIIDSPDFDSALATNNEIARKIAVLSDVTVFVTTVEKYNDRLLVEELRRLKKLKAATVVVFNRIAERVVFDTVAEEIRRVIPLSPEESRVISLPLVQAQHPEETLRDLIRESMLGTLIDHDPQVIKPVIIARLCRHISEGTRDLHRRLTTERALAGELLELLDEEIERAVREYEEAFDLALPEETLAARRLIRQTELWHLLELPPELRARHTTLQAVAALLSRASEIVRRVLLRLSTHDEGTIEDSPAELEEYARARDESDRNDVVRHAESVHRSVETFLRGRETGSPTARAILMAHFDPVEVSGFRDHARETYDQALSRRRNGEDVFAKVEARLKRHPWGRRALTTVAIAAKVAAGIALAALIPPAGVFSLLNWAYFAAGYLTAAYGIALLLSLLVRRKRKFRNARLEIARGVLAQSVRDPVANTVEALLPAADLAALDDLARRIDAELNATGEDSSRLLAGHAEKGA